ncbi:MAG: fluoride efflux transporter CrcB [Pseudomonadota bacterium]
MILLQIALGGAIGAVLRYLTVLGAREVFGPSFPLGTLIANTAGSFAMGILTVLLIERGGEARALSPALMTGVLGAYTTFSAFALDTATLWEDGREGAAALYAGASVGLSLAALAAGLVLARSLAQ